MNFYGLILGSLCVWRITHLLAAEDGPWNLVLKLRRGAPGFWADLLDCFYCLSLWVSAPFALLIGQTWLERALLWPALSAGAILLERLSTRSTPPVFYEEDAHELLRKRESPAPESDPQPPGPQP
jgi:hypothetical protein